MRLRLGDLVRGTPDESGACRDGTWRVVGFYHWKGPAMARLQGVNPDGSVTDDRWEAPEAELEHVQDAVDRLGNLVR